MSNTSFEIEKGLISDGIYIGNRVIASLYKIKSAKDLKNHIYGDFSMKSLKYVNHDYDREVFVFGSLEAAVSKVVEIDRLC